MAQLSKKAQKRAIKAQKKATTPGVFRSIPEYQKQYSLLTPQQQQLQTIIQGLAGNSLKNLSLPGNQQGSFAPQKAEYMRQFQQELIPSLAQRFQNMTNGAGTSPDLYRQLGQGSAQYQSMLDALESQYNLQQQGLQSNNLANLLNASLGQQFDYSIIPEQDSLVKRGFKAAAPALINAGIGALSGGTSGALLGGSLGLGQGMMQNQQQSPQIQQNVSGFSGLNSPTFGGQGINRSVMQGYNNQFAPYGNQLGVANILNSISNGYGQQF